MLDQSSERHVHDRLGSALYKLAIIEQRANEATESPRAVAKLLGEVRKLVAELQRGFAELEHLMTRSSTAERAALTSIARSQLLFDLSPVPCVVLEPAGTVVEANPAAAKFLNISHRHLVGKSFPLFLSSDRKGFLLRLLGLPADGAERWTATLRPRERSAVACDLAAAPDPEGRILVVIVPAAGTDPVAPDDGDALDSTVCEH